LRQAQSSIQRLEDFIIRAREKATPETPSPEFVQAVESTREQFKNALDDDLNTSAALAVIFEFVHSTYQRDGQNALTGGDARLALEFINEVDGVLNIIRPQQELLDEEISAQIEARQAARRRRDFAEADRIRNWLLSKGIVLEDTREGVRWKRSS
jgi:cysteinyl-tRNA synthetase